MARVRSEGWLSSLSDNITWVNSLQELNLAVDEARDAEKRAVVLITAPSWCGPCRQFEPHYARAADNVEDLKFIGILIDDNDWVVSDFGVRGVPECWLFDTDGIFSRKVKVPQGALPFINDIRS